MRSTLRSPPLGHGAERRNKQRQREEGDQETTTVRPFSPSPVLPVFLPASPIPPDRLSLLDECVDALVGVFRLHQFVQVHIFYFGQHRIQRTSAAEIERASSCFEGRARKLAQF